MPQPDDPLSAIRARGELWSAASGLTGLRGDTALLFRTLERAIAGLCEPETADDWRVPPAIDFGALARAQYFASFPHWLTVAAHLSDDEHTLRRVAEHDDPASVVSDASAPPRAAMNPAVCYHIYAALAGSTIESPRVVTAQSPCWRHEGSRHAVLEREWAFTMREVVCVGDAESARAFLERCTRRTVDFAHTLDLDPSVVAATDPFFAPTARAKHLLQQLKELKHELLLPIGGGRSVAASSFNLHDTFFGEAFDIGLPTGEAATTACAAFGIERWLLAFLVRHGPDADRWPDIPAVEANLAVRHG